MSKRLEQVMSGIIAIAGVAIATVLVHREFFARPAGPTSVLTKPEYVSDWRGFASLGRTIGPESAKVKIVEFADIECPFCRRFHEAVQFAQKKYPNEISLVFVHYPLPQHRFARPGARAAECATERNFGQMIGALYRKQDSLGLKTWVSYARDAGVSDTVRFLRCVTDTSKLATVEAGLALGHKLGVHGTPTVFLNGWRYGIAPTDSDLVRAVADLLAGRRPSGG
jgi:protein-disulfide isomerase